MKKPIMYAHRYVYRTNVDSKMRWEWFVLRFSSFIHLLPVTKEKQHSLKQHNYFPATQKRKRTKRFWSINEMETTPKKIGRGCFSILSKFRLDVENCVTGNWNRNEIRKRFLLFVRIFFVLAFNLVVASGLLPSSVRDLLKITTKQAEIKEKRTRKKKHSKQEWFRPDPNDIVSI